MTAGVQREAQAGRIQACPYHDVASFSCAQLRSRLAARDVGG